MKRKRSAHTADEAAAQPPLREACSLWLGLFIRLLVRGVVNLGLGRAGCLPGDGRRARPAARAKRCAEGGEGRREPERSGGRRATSAARRPSAGVSREPVGASGAAPLTCGALIAAPRAGETGRERSEPPCIGSFTAADAASLSMVFGIRPAAAGADAAAPLRGPVPGLATAADIPASASASAWVSRPALSHVANYFQAPGLAQFPDEFVRRVQLMAVVQIVCDLPCQGQDSLGLAIGACLRFFRFRLLHGLSSHNRFRRSSAAARLRLAAGNT